jgi:hypothetical protein
MKIEFYKRHGRNLAVDSSLKGKHKYHCLCYKNCTNFNPGKPDNCKIAELNFQICKIYGVTLPVWECEEYKFDV